MDNKKKISMPIGSAISAGGSLLGAVGSAIFGKSESDKALDVQQRENQLNREHNLKLAQLQNKWNLEQYERNNKYNSPSEQLKRMRQAGLNPDLMYEGAGQLIPAQSPQMTAGEGSHSSVDPKIAPFDAAKLSSVATDNALKMAQVGLIKAETKKTDAEGDIAISDAVIRDAFNSGLLQLQGGEIEFKKSATSLNEGELSKIKPYIDNINAQTSFFKENLNEVRARVRSLTADAVYKEIQNLYADHKFQSEVRHFASVADISEERARRAAVYVALELAGMSSQADLNRALGGQANSNAALIDAQKIGVQVQSDELKFKWDQKSSHYGSVEAMKIGASFDAFLSPVRSVFSTVGAIFGR